MAILEDAAEELVVKLKGLDGEIEESRHALEEARGAMDHAAEEVDREWSALTQAASSLLDKVRQEQDHLSHQMQETARAAHDAQEAIQRDDGELRSETAQGGAHLDSLAQHAAGLEPTLDALAAEAGEAPARSLGERAVEIEQELARLLQEARRFLQDEVGAGLERFTQDVHQRGEQIRRSLAQEATSALQQAFDGWEAQVDDLETFVATQAFAASHENARAYVEWAIEECRENLEAQLDGLKQLGEVLEGQLQELVSEVHQSRQAVLEQGGTELVTNLEDTAQTLASALQALSGVQALLVSYTFLQA